ncbi:MAG: hypothetical protein AAF485_24440, partial [Chloroflexota bacterium]
MNVPVINIIYLIIIIGLSVGLPTLFIRKIYLTKRASWQTLASDQGWLYTPLTWFRGDFISGDFQGYELTIDPQGVSIREQERDTHITLSTNALNKLPPTSSLPDNFDEISTQLM